MKVLVILEFGIPPYRDFLFKFLSENENISELLIVHTGQKFPEFNYKYPNILVSTIKIGNFYFHKKVAKLIKEYDVIISSFHKFRPMCWLPMIWNKNKKWILWMTGVGNNKYPVTNKLFRSYFISKASSLIVYTDQAKNDVINSWNISANRIKVSNNTLLINNAEYSTESRGYFLYVGRIQKRKGLLKALKACSDLRKNYNIDIPFVVVGDGEYKRVVKDYAKKNHIEDLVKLYPGTYDDKVLKKFYSKAIAYLSPDHVGLGVVQSFAYGIPVMTCRNKLHAEEFNYCSDDNSFLYENDQLLLHSIMNAFLKKDLSYTKGINSYSYYLKHLDYNIMNEAFLKAILL